MSLLAHRAAADTVARAMQLGTTLGARRMASAARSRLPEFACLTEVITVPTSIGPTRATLYRPTTGDDPAVHVNLHGGGYILGLTDLDDPLCRAVASQSGAVLVNVDYAIAPQHRFPTAARQVHEVLLWVADKGSDHGWSGGRLSVGGQSAGGGLAAAGARLALEEGGPPLALQVLHYPPLDLSVPVSTKRSVIAKPILRPWMGDVFDTAYAPDPMMRTDRLISPAGIADTDHIAGIAPAVVIAAEHDILRDEARRYADRLDRVGALVDYHEVARADHGYDLKDDVAARETYALIAGHIRQSHAHSGGS